MAKSTGNTCHILPCSLDADTTGYTARYFHPAALPENEATNEGAAKQNGHATIMAAQFRGRGLLCAVDNDSDETNETKSEVISKLPEGMVGVVFAPSSSQHAVNNDSDDNTRGLKIVETFSEVYNWQHEHDVEKVHRSRNEGGCDKVGLKAVLGWCELAHAVSNSRLCFHSALCLFHLHYQSSSLMLFVNTFQVHDPIPLPP